jgi:hypothetical protein
LILYSFILWAGERPFMMVEAQAGMDYSGQS